MSTIATDPVWNRIVNELVGKAGSDTAPQDFILQLRGNGIALLKEALLTPGRHRMAAVALAKQLSLSEQKQLFPELIQAARSAHGPVGAIRDLIFALPRDWVLAHVDALVEPILLSEEYDDYWMFLELFEQLDPVRAMTLARRAAAHSNHDIRELGELVLERLTGSAKL